MFGVSPQKEQALAQRMKALGILEDDLIERFIKGSGSGGQKINKTASCVFLSHPASATDVKCQKTRSQALNRYYARLALCEQLEEKLLGRESKKQQEAEKVRRQKRKRSKRAKEKILKEKKATSEKKGLRKRPKV